MRWEHPSRWPGLVTLSPSSCPHGAVAAYTERVYAAKHCCTPSMAAVGRITLSPLMTIELQHRLMYIHRIHLFEAGTLTLWWLNELGFKQIFTKAGIGNI
jgi:hypothetical protein